MRVKRVNSAYIRRIIAEERQMLKEYHVYERALINEINRMENEGFDRWMINEQVMDFIKNLAGGTGDILKTGASMLGGGFLETLKNKFANWLMEKLGLETDSLLAEAIANAFESIKAEDLPKYIGPEGCTLLSGVVVDSLIETAGEPIIDAVAGKLFGEEGQVPSEGPAGSLYATVRESLSRLLLDGPIGETIKEKVSSLVCDMDIAKAIKEFGGVKNIPAPEI